MNNEMKLVSTFRAIDPYQALFPLGLLHALVGGSVWILFALNLVPYPAVFHTHHMFVGFLLSFAGGFLLTAIPRFTGAARCSPLELSIAITLSLLSLIFEQAIMALATLLFFAAFIVRRLVGKTYSPPPHFIFLPMGLLLGVAGAAIATLVEFRALDPRYLVIARLFLYYGIMLSFLLGIGAKLITALLGWTSLPVHQIAPSSGVRAASTPWLQNKMILPLTQAVIFLSGFLVEILGQPALGRGLRAFCATWIAIQNWKLYHRPLASGKLPFWIWVAAWMLVIGLWTHSIFPSLDVHAAHLIFIGGYGLMTLMVASRVSLAHGGHSLEVESKSKIFAATGILVVTAALTRFVAQWTPSYAAHLAYAGGTWAVAIIIWGKFFLPKIFFHSKD